MSRLLDLLIGWLRRPVGHLELGRRGEKAAARYLRRKGYRIVARGDQTGPGEIDLVAVHRGTVVFVEVKTRRSDEEDTPADAVDERKQRQLTRLAVAFLKRHHLLEHPARFDVVAVTWPEGARRPIIEHYQDAFDAAGQWEFYS